MGFVKLITIRTTEEPIVYLSAIGNGYWIDKMPPWITNVTVQTTVTQPPITTAIVIPEITIPVQTVLSTD